jgi:hypothetical protein
VVQDARLVGIIALKDLLNLVALKLSLESDTGGGKPGRLEVLDPRS